MRGAASVLAIKPSDLNFPACWQNPEMGRALEVSAAMLKFKARASGARGALSQEIRSWYRATSSLTKSRTASSLSATRIRRAEHSPQPAPPPRRESTARSESGTTAMATASRQQSKLHSPIGHPWLGVLSPPHRSGFGVSESGYGPLALALAMGKVPASEQVLYLDRRSILAQAWTEFMVLRCTGWLKCATFALG
jgi:hypothetical protein